MGIVNDIRDNLWDRFKDTDIVKNPFVSWLIEPRITTYQDYKASKKMIQNSINDHKRSIKNGTTEAYNEIIN